MFNSLNMKIKSIYEFLLWDNCNNNCSFCFQRVKPRLFNNNEQEIILDKILAFLDSDEYEKGNHVLIVGGELFYKQFDSLITFFDTITYKMCKDQIDLLYLNTNLIYDKTFDTMLVPVLEYFEKRDLFERLKFTTSYDIAGRFHDKESENLCLSNMIKLSDRFKDLHTVANIILTKPFCNAVLNGTFDLKKFIDTYKVRVNLIPYIVLSESLKPTREEVFSCLMKINDEMPEFIKNYVENMDLRHKRYLYACHPDKFKLCSCENADCGHSVNFRKYSDDPNACYVCDLKSVFSQYE